MREQHAFASDAIEGGRLRQRVTEDARIWPTPIVGQDEQDIGPLIGRQVHSASDQTTAESQPPNQLGKESRVDVAGLHSLATLLLDFYQADIFQIDDALVGA